MLLISIFLASPITTSLATTVPPKANAPNDRVAAGVLLRDDLPGLVDASDFLYPSRTPAAALASFSSGSRVTIEKWWTDPMDPSISREQAEHANAEVQAFIRENNGAIYGIIQREFAVAMAFIDPPARIAPMYRSISSPTGYFTVENVDRTKLANLAQLPAVDDIKALVRPLERYMDNAYTGSRAVVLAGRGATGNGITIGIIDTGVAPSSNLALAGSADVSTGRLIEPSPGPCGPHGTFVAASAASRHSVFRGPASSASIYDIKIWPTETDSNGTRTCGTFNFERALLDGYAVAVDKALPVVVISTGLNSTFATSDNGSEMLSRIVNRNGRLGVPTYIALGNSGQRTSHWPTAPAGAWDAVTVGAANTEGSPLPADATPWGHNSFYGSQSSPIGRGGPVKPDLVAYGSRNDTLGMIIPLNSTHGLPVSGTSFAAPFAAGIGAQLMQLFPMPLAFHPLHHRAALTMGTSVEPIDGALVWRVPTCSSCQTALSASLSTGYGLVDAEHAADALTIRGTHLPISQPLTLPQKLRDGQHHRINAMLVTYANDDGISGLNVGAVVFCARADGSIEGGGGAFFGGANAAATAFALRPEHHDCRIDAFRTDGSHSDVPFVIAVNSEKGWN